MTYRNCKRVIEIQIARGTLDKQDMLAKLDIFLLADRLTEAEYQELSEMVNKA